jgi:hypothetical protein
MIRLPSIALPAFAALLTLSCGVNKKQLPQETAQTICDLIFSCNCDQAIIASKQECVTYLEETTQLAIDEAEVHGLSYDDLNCDPSYPEVDPDAQCKRPCKTFHGPVGKAGTCTQVLGAWDNCKQGLVCDGDGVCVNPCDEIPLPVVGEFCYGGECDEGAWCSFADPAFPTCAALPGVGIGCTPFGECREDLFCDFSMGGTGICAAFPGQGQPCPAFECAEGLVCDTSITPDPLCALLPGAGQMCISGQCAKDTFCNGDGVCEINSAIVCGLWAPVDPGVTATSASGTSTSATGTTGP